LSTTRIECPNCHRQTIKGKFCIYCGYTLETLQQPKPAPVEEVVQIPEQVPEIVAEAPEPAEAAVQTATEEVAVEEKRLVDQLASVYSWYFRLIDLFLEKEADPEVFIELFNEYRGRLKTLNERREAEIKKVEEKINGLNTQLDKLRVKHEIGEIPDRQYITQKLEIDREVGRLRPKLMYLRNPFNIRLGDLPAFKNQVEERLNKVKASSENLGLAEDIINQIEGDTNEVLKVIDVLMEQHHKIRKELNKLELRYKIGELKQSEYLSLKQKLERQLELPGG
jgi:chromosome segregation ATPase